MVSIEPTPSKRLFVGRAQELSLFERVLQRERPEWIIHILGPGGMGKTRLLEQMRELGRERYPDAVLVTREVIDFYKTANHTPLGLLDDLVRQLGQEHFRAFADEVQRFRRLLAGAPDVAERHEAEERVIATFFEEYERLVAERRAVLLFDTCEEMRGIVSWFMNTFLQSLATLGMGEDEGEEERGQTSHTVVVVAGRCSLGFPSRLKPWVVKRRLRPFTIEEAQAYFLVGGLGPDRVGDEELARIHGLAEGRLLYVALVFDWLHNEIGTVEELIAPEEPFGKKLVSWVLRLGGYEAEVVLYMAQAWRRMEPSLLAHLLQIGEKETEEVIGGLARFSFIKYRPPSGNFAGSIQLHDEMRELVLKHAWPQFGSRDVQQQLLRQVSEWYERQICDLEGEEVLTGVVPPKAEKTRYLLAEWLYYRCCVDLDEGFKRAGPLFRQATHHLDLGFGELLNEELGRFRQRLARSQLDELRFREALMAFRRERFEEAVDAWCSLIRQPDLECALRATTLQMLVEAEAYTGHMDEALAHAEEAEKLYQSLLKAPAYEPHRLRLELELGQLYNNWGYAYRAKGDWEQALERYNRALGLRGAPKNVARTLNNIGYVHFLQGDLTAARTYIGRSLSIRKELNIPYELGLGYNTMGIVMECSGRYDNGADLYDKALAAFEEARSERGRALALINLGRLRRVTNSFADAIRYLDEARYILKRKRDYDYLVEAYNELGCVYRQRREEGDWEEAVRWLEKSHELAKAIGNAFRQADNLEDLSVLYVQWAKEKLQWGEKERAEERLGLAEAKGQEAIGLARAHGYDYLEAKILRNFGDVIYARGEYERAFEHYLETCTIMANVVTSEWGSVVQMRRRYEEMVDHLQEQLHGLPPQEEIALHARRLRDELNKRKLADQLGELTRALDQSLSVSQQIRIVKADVLAIDRGD